MGRSSQSKGRTAERELASLLRDKYGFADIKAAEPLNYGTVPDLVGLPGVHIECKRCEKLKITEWMQQAERDAERFKDGAPVVFHRRNRQPWLVTLHLEDFVQIYREGGVADGAHQEKAGPDRGQADSSGPAD